MPWIRRFFAALGGGDPRDRLARDGEAEAARHLERLGHRILARRARTRLGEIDLVAERGELLVFVEVKTRRSRDYAAPAEAVGRDKAEHIRRAAMAWLRRHPELAARRFRIDVVEIVWPEAGEPEVRHLEDAVDRGSWL